MRQLLSFPSPVNEKAARVVAGVVLATVLVTLVTTWYWLLIPLAYRFWARVLTGPKLSPLGWEERCGPAVGGKEAGGGSAEAIRTGDRSCDVDRCPGPRVCRLPPGGRRSVDRASACGWLESIFGYCVGCKAFGPLMHLGVVPESVCAECADITLRLRATASTPSTPAG